MNEDGAAERAATECAATYLLEQADRQFAEVCHRMKFSFAAGFSGVHEEHSGDIFARATLANLFLDAADAMPIQLATSLRAVARREAMYVAESKVRDRAGGWSYFPTLPELPPDADSLSAALCLFSRIAPEYVPLCQAPIDLLLANAKADGTFETWMIAPTDASSDQAKMRWAIKNCWGTGADPDVLAHFYYALWLAAPKRYAAAISRGAATLIEMQQADGSWRAEWYVGAAYGTGLAVRLLRAIGAGEAARTRAQVKLLSEQHEDGSWGDEQSRPLQTSLCMAALHAAEPGAHSMPLARGATSLRAQQLEDGSWAASPWIQMEIGRATGHVLRVATYQSTVLTAAFCLRALLLGTRGVRV